MVNLYFSDRKEYYIRKNTTVSKVRESIKIERRIKQYRERRIKQYREVEQEKVLRYSVAFMMVRGGDYGKTLRAIILDPQPLARRKLIVSELKERLRRKMQKEGVWGIPTEEAFEREEIDLIEAEGQPRNEIFFEGFDA